MSLPPPEPYEVHEIRMEFCVHFTYTPETGNVLDSCVNGCQCGCTYCVFERAKRAEERALFERVKRDVPFTKDEAKKGTT